MFSCAQGFDLVIHTAGPFQWKLTSSVLEAAIAAKVPYIDVADDADFSAVREPYPVPYIPSAEVRRLTAHGVQPALTVVHARDRAGNQRCWPTRYLAVYSLLHKAVSDVAADLTSDPPTDRAAGLAVSSHMTVASLRRSTSSLFCCQRAKGYHEQAVAAGVPAITTAGIYPGTSNVMAAHLVSLARKVRLRRLSSIARLLLSVRPDFLFTQDLVHPGCYFKCGYRCATAVCRNRQAATEVRNLVVAASTAMLTVSLPCGQEYDDEGNYREAPGEGAIEPERLRFSYYTAGSGGVGPTIMATSMLLAGEPVVAFKDGKKVGPILDRYKILEWNFKSRVLTYTLTGCKMKNFLFVVH